MIHPIWINVRLSLARRRGCFKPHLFFWRREDGSLGCRAQSPGSPSASLLGVGRGDTVREAIESCHRDVMYNNEGKETLAERAEREMWTL